MNTKQIKTEYRMAHWAGIIRERLESGLTIRAFCKAKGFHTNIFFYWQKKLREAACEQLAEIRNRKNQLELKTGRFTEVKLVGTSERLPLKERQGDGEIRIETAGISISANSAYPASNIVELIKGLHRI